MGQEVKHICVNSGQSIYKDRIPGRLPSSNGFWKTVERWSGQPATWSQVDFHYQIVFEKLLKGDQVNLQAAQEHGKRSAASLSDLGAWIYVFNRG